MHNLIKKFNFFFAFAICLLALCCVLASCNDDTFPPTPAYPDGVVSGGGNDGLARATSIPLRNGKWRNDSIDTPDGEKWYSFDVAASVAYRIWWNDSYEGNNSKTLNVWVSLYANDSELSISEDSAWNYPMGWSTSGTTGGYYITSNGKFYL
jgi:hypothetical protein